MLSINVCPLHKYICTFVLYVLLVCTYMYVLSKVLAVCPCSPVQKCCLLNICHPVPLHVLVLGEWEQWNVLNVVFSQIS